MVSRYENWGANEEKVGTQLSILLLFWYELGLQMSLNSPPGGDRDYKERGDLQGQPYAQALGSLQCLWREKPQGW